mmetsp:Transcript_17860/g.27605  ORF Transcript_17860/g.27605 Transcript_17860/m.27605 type:complete len:387 (+) Transcript_17860:555-1715(+)
MFIYKKKESALIPIKADCKMEGSHVLVYDQKSSAFDCMRAFHLFNNTDSILAPGSIAVIENGHFVSQTEFTPMIPGDDQLIFYTPDTSVSVSSSQPPELQTSTIESVSMLKQGYKHTGCRKSIRRRKVTEYSIKNNSTTKPVEKLYIDHSASAEYGGYVIVTKENAIKSVTGWSRFNFSLKPLEEITFHVIEELVHSRDLSNQRELRSLLRESSTGNSFTLSKEIRTDILNLLKNKYLASSLDSLRGSSFSRQDLINWLGGVSITCDGEIEIISYLPQELADAAEKILTLKNSIACDQFAVDGYEKHIKEVFTNQSRLRDNIRSMEKLKTCSKLLERYLSDLDKEEDDLLKTREQIAVLTKTIQDTKNLLGTAEIDLTRLCDNYSE